MRVIAILMMVTAMAACGADGEPIQPTAQANVHVTPNGVGLGTNLRVGKGPFSLGLGVSL